MVGHCVGSIGTIRSDREGNQLWGTRGGKAIDITYQFQTSEKKVRILFMLSIFVIARLTCSNLLNVRFILPFERDEVTVAGALLLIHDCVIQEDDEWIYSSVCRVDSTLHRLSQVFGLQVPTANVVVAFT